MNILALFLEFYTRMKPNVLYVKNKKKNKTIYFQKDELNLLHMRKNETKYEKRKIFVEYEKLKTLNNFQNIVNCMVSHH